MLDWYMLLKVYICFGLATYIHFLWVYRVELIECHKEAMFASVFADVVTLFDCVVRWPYIQYLNIFGKEEK